MANVAGDRDVGGENKSETVPVDAASMEALGVVQAAIDNDWCDVTRRAAEDAVRRKRLMDRWEPQLARRPYLGGYAAPDDGDLCAWLTVAKAANIDREVYPACWRWYHAFERSTYLAQKRARSPAKGTVAVAVGFTKIEPLKSSERFDTDTDGAKSPAESSASPPCRYSCREWTAPEKVDGSNLLFGCHDGRVGQDRVVMYWSKGDALDYAKISRDVTFKVGVKTVERVKHMLNPDYRYASEVVGRARQNRVLYGRVPGVVVFGIQDVRTGMSLEYDELVRECQRTGLTPVALLARSCPENVDEDPADVCRRVLATRPTSFLGGGGEIEGIVLHLYDCRDSKSRRWTNVSEYRPLVKRKLVSREFAEEKHKPIAETAAAARIRNSRVESSLSLSLPSSSTNNGKREHSVSDEKRHHSSVSSLTCTSTRATQRGPKPVHPALPVATCARKIGATYAVFARWTKAVERLRDRGAPIDYMVRASLESICDDDGRAVCDVNGSAVCDVNGDEKTVERDGESVRSAENRVDRNIVAAFAPLDALLASGNELAIDLDKDLRAERRSEITAKLSAYRDAALGTVHEATWPAIVTPDALFDHLFPQVAVAARHGLDEWCRLVVGAERRQICNDWQTQEPHRLSRSREFTRQLELVANYRIAFPPPL